MHSRIAILALVVLLASACVAFGAAPSFTDAANEHAYVKMLASDDAETVCEGLEPLTGGGPLVPLLKKQILNLTVSENDTVRIWAMFVVASNPPVFDSKHVEEIEGLVKASRLFGNLDGADTDRCRLSISVIRAFASRGWSVDVTGPAIVKLIPLLQSKAPEIRSASIYALASIGTPAVPPLADMVRHGGSPGTTATEVLARMGKAAKPAVPALMGQVEKANDRNCIDAAAAVARIDPYALALSEGAAKRLPSFIDALHKGDRELRIKALIAIAALGPKAASAVPATIDYVLDVDFKLEENTYLDLYFQAAWERIGPASIPPLLRIVRSGDLEHRMAAAAVLCAWHAREPGVAQSVAPLLTSLQHDQDPEVRKRAAALRNLLDKNLSEGDHVAG